jgi:hypothetical protein
VHLNTCQPLAKELAQRLAGPTTIAHWTDEDALRAVPEKILIGPRPSAVPLAALRGHVDNVRVQLHGVPFLDSYPLGINL